MPEHFTKEKTIRLASNESRGSRTLPSASLPSRMSRQARLARGYRERTTRRPALPANRSIASPDGYTRWAPACRTAACRSRGGGWPKRSGVSGGALPSSAACRLPAARSSRPRPTVSPVSPAAPPRRRETVSGRPSRRSARRLWAEAELTRGGGLIGLPCVGQAVLAPPIGFDHFLEAHLGPIVPAGCALADRRWAAPRLAKVCAELSLAGCPAWAAGPQSSGKVITAPWSTCRACLGIMIEPAFPVRTPLGYAPIANFSHVNQPPCHASWPANLPAGKIRLDAKTEMAYSRHLMNVSKCQGLAVRETSHANVVRNPRGWVCTATSPWRGSCGPRSDRPLAWM